MRIINGVAYAKESVSQLEVVTVKSQDDWMMMVQFNNGEEQLFDATELFYIPAFQPLKQQEAFKQCKVEDGVVTWLDGGRRFGTRDQLCPKLSL